MNKARSWHLSATAIAEYKRCPYAFMLKYVKGIRRAEDTEAQRYGSNWHRVLEILSMPPAGNCVCTGSGGCTRACDPHCLLCGGSGTLPDDLMDAAVRVLNEAYADVPPGVDPEDWEVERIKLLYSASAYRWYYADDPLETIVREHHFKVAVPNPFAKNNSTLRQLTLGGIIDKIVRRTYNYVVEHKSTGSSLDDAETTTKFWKHLNLDTQTLLYPFICQLDPELAQLDVRGVLYDAYHKPTIRPKKLTQAESAEFLKTCEYCGQKFAVDKASDGIVVDGKVAQVELGKKEGAFAIRETPEMYGARLLQDICSRPQFYFARREIPRTKDDLFRFNIELANIYQMIKLAYSADCWIHCERQCEATFKCEYIDLCYNGVDPDDELPAGLIRTFEGKEGAAAQ
jgi:hypothetical protein